MEDYTEQVIKSIECECCKSIECECCYQEESIADTLVDIVGESRELVGACKKWLVDHDRCIYCGSKLQVIRGREYHSEVGAYEPYCEKYCPICDLGG